MSYKIIKFRFNGTPTSRGLPKGLTLDEAQRYCKRDDTHKLDKNGNVVWFCGFTEE